MGIALFLLVPLLASVLTLAFTGRRRLQSRISMLSDGFLLACALLHIKSSLTGKVEVLRLGDWPPALGIVWVADGLSSLMLALTATLALSTAWYSSGSSRDGAETYYLPLHHLLVFGVNGCFLTGDLFNLFVFFEVMLLTSFAQMTLGRETSQLRRIFPYVAVNLVASMIFLFGIGLLYASMGTVNVAHLAVALAAQPPLPAASVGIGLVLFVLGLKAALAPLFFWLPDSYPAAPASLAALFAGLLTKVGVYAFFRLLPLLPPSRVGHIQAWLLPVSVATMILGVLGALGRKGFREILSFHIVSQIGYIVFSLTLWTTASLAAGIFYLAHNMVVKTALVLSSGIVEGLERQSSQGVRGMAVSHPGVAAGFFVPAMALAGMPPLSGFWAKFFVLRAGFASGAWASTAIAVLVSLLTLASMLKIWNQVFWGAPSARGLAVDYRMKAAVLSLAALSVAGGVLASPVFLRLEVISGQLMSPGLYVNAVLGPKTEEHR